MSYKGNEGPSALKDFIIFDYTLVASSARNGYKESELPYDSYFGRYYCCDINSVWVCEGNDGRYSRFHGRIVEDPRDSQYTCQLFSYYIT